MTVTEVRMPAALTFLDRLDDLRRGDVLADLLEDFIVAALQSDIEDTQLQRFSVP